MAILRLQGEAEKKKNIYFEVDSTDAPIGEGGMGKVMKGICVDIATKVSRPVAIKFLYADLPEHAIERARREASIQLRNDNLIEMLGFIEVDTVRGSNTVKHYHVVSELLHGISLAELLDGKCCDKAGNEIAFLKNYTIPILTAAPGGFFTFGIMIALMNKLTSGKAPARKSFSCEGCPNAASCGKASCDEVKEENTNA